MSGDDWMKDLHPEKLAEIEREQVDFDRSREIMRLIAPELVDIANRLSPAPGYLNLERFSYYLIDALFAEATARGMARYADIINFLPQPKDPAPRSTETAVYRAFDASGRLLYVGITNNPRTRMRGHEKTSEWWSEMQSVSFEWCATRLDAEQLERELVSTLRPPFNTSMNPEAGR